MTYFIQMPTDLYNRLAEIAAEQHGLVTQEDARELGIPPDRLVTMARRDLLDRAAFGIYRLPLFADALTPYMEATLWPHRTRGVLSHETALDLYELSDVNPAKIHFTVPAGFRIRREVPAGYEVHHADLDPTETTLYEGIPIATPLRAIKDVIGTGLDRHLVEQAIDTALRRGRVRQRDLPELERLLGRPIQGPT